MSASNNRFTVREALARIARTGWRLSLLGTNEGEIQFIRYSMYKSIIGHAANLDFGNKVVSISHSGNLCRLVQISEANILHANHPKYDICKLDLPDNAFTAVVSDQVLEHIACEPNRAIDECYRILAPGGLALHTTCFLTPYHGSPDFEDAANGDYWRFTPSGLRVLHKRYTRILCAEGWGNPFVGAITALGLHCMPVPESEWHPINKLARYNRFSYAWVVWIIAQK